MSKKRIWAKSDIDKIIFEYTVNKKTLSQIAPEFNTKSDTISKLLKSNGVELSYRKQNRFINDCYFEICDSPTKAYFIGLMFTDGSVCVDTYKERQTSVGIELAEYDSDILDKFKQELNMSTKLVHKVREHKTTTVSLKIRSNKMASDLSKYGIVQNKTEVTRHLCLDYIPNTYMKDFFRGVIDGDGSIYYSLNLWHVNLTEHFESITKELYELGCLISGINPSCKIQCSNNTYKAIWNGANAKKLLKEIYYDGCCSIDRKYKKAMLAIQDNSNKTN